MTTFTMIAGLIISLVLVLGIAFKIHDDENKSNNQNIDKDIENLGKNIDQEIQNLEQEIEEFEL
ncbi:MAG: hypothetical protein ACQEP3_02495 [Patescibacteria group bacterium]